MKFTPLYAADPEALDCMLDLLNDGECNNQTLSEADSEELHALMEDWLAAGMQWSRFISHRIATNKDIDSIIRGTFYLRIHGTHPLLIPFPMHPDKPSLVKSAFLRFVLHPECRRLSSRCKREQCRRYFVRRTAHAQVYCSRRCARLDTAVAAMQKKRKAERDAQVERAKAALRKYENFTPNRRPKDWRKFVVTKAEITSRTLSSWLSRGWIQAPGEIPARRAARAAQGKESRRS